MSTTTDLTTLKINFLTQSQYNTAKAQGLIEDDEIYMTETSCLVSNKVGAIVAYAGSDEPQGWFKCDGRAVSRTDYAELFATIGTTFGSGDGSTTFNIPDLRGRVATGVGTLSGNTYTLGDDVDAGLPNITGSLYQRSTNYNVGNITWTGGGALAVSNDTTGTADGLSQVNGAVARKKIDLNASNSNSIYGKSTTVQPNTLVLNFLICYENSVISGSGGGGPVDSTDVPTETKIAEFDSNAHMNSTDMTTQALETYVDSLDIQGSVFVDATDVPTAGEIAKFDSTANMSSTDMTTGSGGEVEAFVNGLNVSGAGGQTQTRKLLWTNTTATASFATQTISLDLSDYDHVEVWFFPKNETDAFFPNPVMCRTGESAWGVLLHNIYGAGVNENTGARKVAASSTGVAFGNYVYKNRRSGGSLTTDNSFAIPQYIYGIKYV